LARLGSKRKGSRRYLGGLGVFFKLDDDTHDYERKKLQKNRVPVFCPRTFRLDSRKKRKRK